MINRRCSRNALLLARAVLACTAAVTLWGCGTYVPEGATVVEIKNSKREYDRGSLFPANELAANQHIAMKWYDTNTFLTTATLAPGIYDFRARNYEGAAISRDIKVVPDQDLYEVDLAVDRAAKDNAGNVAGPVIKGRLQGIGRSARVSNVAVVFIGKQVAMRTANVKPDGSFEVNAPSTGHWRIEVHLLGDMPKSYAHDVMNVQAPVDLGAVVLR